MSKTKTSSSSLFGRMMRKTNNYHHQQQQRNGRGDLTSATMLMMVVIAMIFMLMMTSSTEAFDIGSKATPLTPKLRSVLGNNCTVATVERDCGGMMTLVCLEGRCSLCNESVQCSSQIDSVYSCKFMGFFVNQTNFTSTGGVCDHKDLGDYFSLFDLFSVLTNFIGSVLSSAGGTGGGGVFVPLLHVLGRFNAQEAVPLSKVMIFGAAITNVFTLFFRSHPYAKRPLIDYDIALMMEPATLLGTIIGVFLNIICPEWVIVLSVIIVLTITTILTFRKFFQRARVEFAFLWKKKKKNEETEPLTKEQDEQSTPSSVDDSNNNGKEEESPSATQGYGSVNTKEEESTSANALVGVQPIFISQQVAEKDFVKPSAWTIVKQTPYWKIFVLIICWIIIFTFSLLRGGEGAPSVIPGLEMCSPVYWVLVGLSFPVIGGIMVIVAGYLLIDYRRKVKRGHVFVQGDVKWNWINVTFYPGACLIAGILASMLGIGGGMIKSPLLLLLGSDPAVGAATAAFMIFFTSSISSAQFAIVGRIPFDYGMLYGLTGFFSGFVGYFFVTFGVERWGKRSLIILCVGLVLLFATMLMGGVGIYDVVTDIQQGVYMGFHDPCRA